MNIQQNNNTKNNNINKKQKNNNKNNNRNNNETSSPTSTVVTGWKVTIIRKYIWRSRWQHNGAVNDGTIILEWINKTNDQMIDRLDNHNWYNDRKQSDWIAMTKDSKIQDWTEDRKNNS